MSTDLAEVSETPKAFKERKDRILELLSSPDEAYDDLSPKGSIDEAIKPLIDEINRLDGFVTTSSCGGRVSVFVEGVRKSAGPAEAQVSHIGDNTSQALPGLKSPTKALATSGGKGGGGTWLFVSHEPIKIPIAGCALGREPLTALFDLSRRLPEQSLQQVIDNRYIHFKFEPMILHILTSSLVHAQQAVSAAMQAGFRESGVQGLLPNSEGETLPMVAVRSSGLSLDCVVGIVGNDQHNIAIVDEAYLMTVVQIANARFAENFGRIYRFRECLMRLNAKDASAAQTHEDKETRRKRKAAEGIARREAKALSHSTERGLEEEDDLNLDSIIEATLLGQSSTSYA